MKRRHARTALVAGVALAFTVACAAGPDYVRPPVVTPSEYKEVRGWAIAAPHDEVARGDWWRIFADHELDSIVPDVRVSNQNVAAAEAQFRQARAAVREARSGFFPQV